MDETEKAPFNIDEINKEWSALVSQYVTNSLLLKKEIERLKGMQQENANLKAQVHQAQVDLLAAQGKAVIDDR